MIPAGNYSASANTGPVTSGPIGNSQRFSFAADSAFNVGSGSASGSAGAGVMPSSQSSVLIYVALGVGLLAVMISLRK